MPEINPIKHLTTWTLFALWLALAGCQPSADSPSDQLEVASVGLYAGALSDRGQWAIVGSVHQGVSLWRTSDKERLYNWHHGNGEHTNLSSADFTPDEQWAITTDATTLVLWNMQTGKGERYWQAPADILSAKLTPNGRFALLGLSNHTAVLFDVINGGVVRTLHHNNRVRSVDVSREGQHALTGSEDYEAVFWDLNTGAMISKLQHTDEVQVVALSNDGEMAFSVSKYDKAVLWNTSNGQTIGELPLRAEAIKRGLRFTAARFSQDNRWLLTGRPDQIVSLWQVDQLMEVQRWQVPKRKLWKPQGASIVDVSFSDDENQFLALTSNGFISYLSR